MSKKVLFAIALTAMSGAALAQTNTPADTRSGTKGMTSPTQGTTNTPSTRSTTDGMRNNGMNTDAMKNDTMKNDTMKNGAMKNDDAMNSNAKAESNQGNANATKANNANAMVTGNQSQMKGIVQANTATMAVRFVSMGTADMTTSKLVGVNVYNNQNESLGEIEDLVLQNGRTVTGVIIGVGGLLGIGESYVVVDPASLVVAQKDNTWRAYIDTTKDNLKNAPKFKYEKTRS